MRLTSVRNPVVQFARSLERASSRREHGMFLVEGVRLVADAMRAGQKAALVLYDPDLLSRTAQGVEVLESVEDWADRSFHVDERVLKAAAQTESPSGVVAAVAFQPTQELSNLRHARLGLILDAVSDPGNAGTLLRSAEAFGAAYAMSTPGSVDLFSPKVVRAAMGAHFRIPLYPNREWREIREVLDDVILVAGIAAQGESSPVFTWPDHAALVVGSEAQGLTAEAMQLVDARIHIPMEPGIDSLNAGVAGSILLYSALAN